MTRLYRYLRLKLAYYGLLPRSRLARFTAYVAAIDLCFFVVEKLLGAIGKLPGTVGTLSVWVSLFNVFLSILFALLAMRWARLHLMWRLRNRLIVTYMFIGVIPVVLLVSMAGIAAYLFAGQFATFLATADIRAELDKLDASNATISRQIAMELREGRPV